MLIRNAGKSVTKHVSRIQRERGGCLKLAYNKHHIHMEKLSTDDKNIQHAPLKYV